MVNLCKYKELFGKPHEGIHSYRLFDLAVVDILETVVIVFIICRIFNWPYLPMLALAFLTGIIAHRLFCVRTTVDKWLFG